MRRHEPRPVFVGLAAPETLGMTRGEVAAIGSSIMSLTSKRLLANFG